MPLRLTRRVHARGVSIVTQVLRMPEAQAVPQASSISVFTKPIGFVPYEWTSLRSFGGGPEAIAKY